MSDEALRSIVDRILRCREAEDEAKRDTKELYAEAKANGYDVVTIGLIVRRERQKAKGLQVYFAAFEAKNLLKIGISTNVPKRLKTLEAQAGCASELLLTMPGIFAEEGWYHAQFNQFRIKGEWFQLCPESRRYVEKAREYGVEMWGVA